MPPVNPSKSNTISPDDLKVNPNDPQLLSKITQALYANNFALETERNRIQGILLNVSEVIFAMDQDFKLTIFNRRAEDVFGKEHQQVLGKFASKQISIIDEDKKKEINPTDYAFKDKQFIIPRVKIKTKGHESEYYKLSSTFVESGDQKHKEAVVILSNITAEVELDKQKDEFISVASHELKTPISITKNNLWMFKHVSKKKFSKREERFLSEMGEGLERLQKIVNNLLDIKRIENGTLT